MIDICQTKEMTLKLSQLESLKLKLFVRLTRISFAFDNNN
jgi:hypothetical protein